MRRMTLLPIGLLLSVLPGSFGCNGQLTPQAREILRGCYDAYWSGDNRDVIRRADAFLRDNRRSKRADEAYYLRGLAKYELTDMSGARADLNEALGRTRNKDIRARALLALGDLAHDTGEMDLAGTMYRQALASLESGAKPGDHARYRLGCVLQRQGRWRQADVHFDRVIYFFDGSELARRAERRVRCSDWTIQVGAFADKPRADAAAAQLRANKINAFTHPVLDDNRPVFVVQIGRYPTYEQAAVGLAEVKRQQSDAFVTVTR